MMMTAPAIDRRARGSSRSQASMSRVVTGNRTNAYDTAEDVHLRITMSMRMKSPTDPTMER
jgi:hypothetical protein